MTHLDTASIAAGRIRAAIVAAEGRRERQRKGETEPTPIEQLTTKQAPLAHPRTSPAASSVCRQKDTGEDTR